MKLRANLPSIEEPLTWLGYLDQQAARRCIHFMPNCKRATVELIPFEV